MNRILIKKTSVKLRKPDVSELMLGELAINTEDGKIFFKSKTGDLHEFNSFTNGILGIAREVIIDSILLVWLFISCLILVTVLKYSI